MRLLKQNFGFLLLMFLTATRVVFFCNTRGGIFACVQSPEKGPFEFFEPIKQHLSERARKYLPSPHSELVLGMTIGVDDLSKSPRFKDALKRTGTIHVVVVSGFNMSLVAGYALKIFGSPYKVKNLLLTIITTFFYAAFTGFEPPVLRAWVMSSFMLVGKFSGRLLNSLRLLVVSYFGVLLINPGNFFSASTYLSFLATFGLIVFADPVESFITKEFFCPANGLADNIRNVRAGKSDKFIGKRPRFMDGSYNYGTGYSGFVTPRKSYVDDSFSFLRFFYKGGELFLRV
ncbi:MAG: internalization-related competence protein ComEC/Rec2 protein [candidate division WWE3 bacterium GW2011_GWF1_42_51]|nr:MAG: internalization-related competence protein ComEC/Rec2 protein [candidate division WWE3 bacterium GW2011_GWF1_42_51]